MEQYASLLKSSGINSQLTRIFYSFFWKSIHTVFFLVFQQSSVFQPVWIIDPASLIIPHAGLMKQSRKISNCFLVFNVESYCFYLATIKISNCFGRRFDIDFNWYKTVSYKSFYASAPLSCIAKLLNKIVADNADGMVIMPNEIWLSLLYHFILSRRYNCHQNRMCCTCCQGFWNCWRVMQFFGTQLSKNAMKLIMSTLLIGIKKQYQT